MTLHTPYSKTYNISWSPKGQYTQINHIIFMALPLVLFILLFIFRKKMEKTSKLQKYWFCKFFGLLTIAWAVWPDIIHLIDVKINLLDSLSKHFISGFNITKMILCMIGAFMLLGSPKMLFWITPTALFIGMSKLVYGFHDTAGLYNVLTYSVFMTIIPAIVLTMSKLNFGWRQLIHGHLFNGAWIAIMYFVNKYFGTLSGELSSERLSENIAINYVEWPHNLLIWIGMVSLTHIIYFAFFRVIFWKTHLSVSERIWNVGWRKSDVKVYKEHQRKVVIASWFSFGKILKEAPLTYKVFRKDLSMFKSELEVNKNEWFGFKWWGEFAWWKEKQEWDFVLFKIKRKKRAF